MIGVIIVNYNTPEDTLDCIESIKQTCGLPYTVYIVDNVSTDQSFQLLSERFNQDSCVKVMLSDRNGGYSYGNNIGIKQAIDDGCDYILISNPDIIYEQGTIEKLYKDLQDNKKIAVVGPSTPSLDQNESQLLRKVYTPGVYLFSKKPFLYLSKVFKGLRTEYPYPTTGDDCPWLFRGMVRGCCYMMPSEVLSAIDLLDDHVFLYSEEWILAKKLADRGLLCGFDYSVKALHKEATSTRKQGTGFQSYHLYLSAYYYLDRYCHSKRPVLFFFYLQNIGSFTLKSILRPDYRKLYRKFVTTQTELFTGKRDRIEM